MFNSQEKIESSFLIDDINDLLQLHLDVVDSYQRARQHARDEEFAAHLDAWIERHRDDIKELAELSRRHGGEPRDKPDLGQVGTRLRVAVARVFSDRGLVDALRANEEKLLLEYERAINSLAELPGMETVLNKNAADIRERMEQLSASR